VGGILVSDKAREPGKEGLDFSTNLQQDMITVCQSLYSYNQEVRADMAREDITRKKGERLNPQLDIAKTDLNHTQILAEKVQSVVSRPMCKG